MISRQLIDLLNSGEAVSVLGSGISIDSGIPTWDGLFNAVADSLDREHHDTHVARNTAKKGKLPDAFDLLALQTTSRDIHERIEALVEQVSTPGRHHHQLADWPFRFHVTTNFDRLIEAASAGRLVSVGNRGTELRKVVGGLRNFVWHPHGCCKLNSDINQLVITKSDYDDFYPSSNMVDRLKAISTAFRCVFVGFGFKDEDFTNVLEAVGRLGHSGRPSFAFIGYEVKYREAREHQNIIRSKYNVEVIPYLKRDNDHFGLQRVLEAYAPFVVHCSISLRSAGQASPTYDPVTSSLIVQRGLDIGMSTANASLRETLIGARVIAHIKMHPGRKDEDLEPLYRSGDPNHSDISECVAKLRKSGLLTSYPLLDLTAEYRTKTATAEAQIDLKKDQICASLVARVVKWNLDLDDTAQKRVVNAGFAFLDKLCRERGLGVAQNLATSSVEQASRRTASLVQHLPESLATCTTRDEAFAVVHLAVDILTKPTEAEAAYLGLLCQAYFGQHLIGASETLAKVDLDLISGTCYVLDASVLVCLLSEGSEVHEFASNLIADLSTRGAILTTTSLFLEETAEHAHWAANLIEKYGDGSPQIIAALSGLEGYRRNQFLRGYFLGALPDTSFTGYLGRILGAEKSADITSDLVEDRLESLGIKSLSFNEWEGLEKDCLVKRETIRLEIHQRRAELGTYKHDRQTQAEAEVAIIVDGIRRGTLQPPGAEAQDAFFLSSTRVVDRLPNLERRICLFPEGLAQWLWSSQVTSSRHAELVFQQLLWELAQGGIEFVDRATLLHRFSGVIEAAEIDLKTSISSRREYLVEKYGPNPIDSFTDADPLDFPRLASEVQQEALIKMEESLKASKKRELEARATVKMGEKDLNELVRLRENQKKKRLKAQKKQRAAQSMVGKKRRRQKKKKK